MPPAQLGLQTCATIPDLFVEVGVSLTFDLRWPQIVILLIITSQTGITGGHHQPVTIIFSEQNQDWRLSHGLIHILQNNNI
jgi:hypothetical protein